MPKKEQKSKARITITLRKDLMPLLDNFIDGDRIRNRSHAIEFILGQHLGLGLQQAVILAGAEDDGTLQALTRVRNRPIIAYQFDMLKNFGVRKVIIVLDDKGEELRDYLGDGEQWGMKVTYVHDKERTGTAGALRLVKPLIENTFVLLFSDVLADINLVDMVEHHQSTGGIGSVALTYKRDAGVYGVARMEGNNIVEFDEKPGKEGRHGLVNAGMYIFEPSVFEKIGDDVRSMERDVFPAVADSGKLTGYPFQSRWFKVSTEKGLKKAEADWRR
jgi:NDP-sugar pyrophosphorylase family protein